MNQTTVVNRRVEKFDVYIGRGSKWGNPFSHLAVSQAQWHVGSRAEAIEKYEQWVRQQPRLLAALDELRGQRLGCYCKPAACHGDVLVKLLKEKDVKGAELPSTRS